MERSSERARAASWTDEEFLAVCLQRELAAREAHGGESRIRAGRFPECKSREDFDVEHQRSLERETLAHLGTLDFIANEDNVVFLGAPGNGKTHLALGLGTRACQAGHRTPFATAAERVALLADSSMLADLGRGWFGCTRHGDAGAHPKDDGIGLIRKSTLPVETFPVLIANLSGFAVIGGVRERRRQVSAAGCPASAFERRARRDPTGR